ncbi:MAG: hypothetical protein LBB74_03140 [Chitinispirillales bacterium]|jgi:hypothetical protein|nr:hypothetical protein [Chitinispirillales bacterium]
MGKYAWPKEFSVANYYELWDRVGEMYQRILELLAALYVDCGISTDKLPENEFFRLQANLSTFLQTIHWCRDLGKYPNNYAKHFQTLPELIKAFSGGDNDAR